MPIESAKATLLIKNNLTLLSPIELIGSSGHIQLQITLISTPTLYTVGVSTFVVDLKKVDISDQKVVFMLTEKESLFYPDGPFKGEENSKNNEKKIVLQGIDDMRWIKDNFV